MNNNILEDLELFNEIIKEFLNEEKTTPASKFISPENIMKEIDLKLDKHPLDNEKYKKLLKQLINSTPKSSSKHFFNQLYGGRHSKAVLGDLLAVILNTSMATFKIAGPQVIVEKTILETISNIVGYSNESGGTFPTGGSMSNFMSMIIARDKKNNQIKDKGFKDNFTAYTSKISHYSVAKNASFCGLGKENVRYIPTNDLGQMDVKILENQIKEDLNNGLIPFYINATSGTTVLCAFDNIDEISKLVKKYDLWLHVDGAFGGSVLFSDKYKHLIKGVENSDSFCFNAHKTLGVPLSTSILVVKNSDTLQQSFSNKASYLYQTHDNEYNLGYSSFECGRRNNALKFWVLWKSVGSIGLEQMIDHEFALAQYARDYVKNNDNYKLYNDHESMSVCFNYKNYDPQDLCKKLYEYNKLMVGYGNFKNISFVRLVTINSQNSNKEIDSFFKILEQFCEEHDDKIKKIN